MFDYYKNVVFIYIEWKDFYPQHFSMLSFNSETKSVRFLISPEGKKGKILSATSMFDSVNMFRGKFDFFDT